MADNVDRTPDRASLYHYNLNLILGEGGTGRVYRAIDSKKGEVVAVKRFRENFFRNPMHKRDLKKSVKRFKKLKNDNVVQIYDFFDKNEDDGNCMVMEYVDGINLHEYMLRPKWDLTQRHGIAIQMCNGLQYLHDHKIVHHDFKPANVLFTRTGKAKIADFSLYGSSFILELLDKGASEQVTPKFVAPEFLRKEKTTALSDQYSFGVTLYMLFTQEDPFPADNLQKLYYSHLHIVPQHPSSVNQNCPRPLGDVVMKCLAKKPSERFEDFDMVRTVLASIDPHRI
jgi:serine/threonine protein kinase